jgi:hypothetical protein
MNDNIEITYLNHLNEYMNNTIPNRISNTLSLRFYHYVLKLNYQNRNYLIFIFDYHDLIDVHYQYTFDVIFEYTKCIPVVLYKFTGKTDPYLSLSFFAIIASDQKKEFYNSNLLKLFTEYKFNKHIRIVCITNIDSNELQIKLRLLNNHGSDIITYQDLNKAYSLYIFTNYNNKYLDNIHII